MKKTIRKSQQKTRAETSRRAIKILVEKQEGIKITDITQNKHEHEWTSSLNTVLKVEEEDINPKLELLSPPAAKAEENDSDSKIPLPTKSEEEKGWNNC